MDLAETFKLMGKEVCMEVKFSKGGNVKMVNNSGSF